MPIHCIANSADEGFTTRVLDAVGSIVTTTHDPRELATMIDDCSALMIQMGPTNNMREGGIASAVEHAQKSRKPWVLDTLLAHRSPFRTEFLRSQLAHRPTIVRAAPEDITATLIKRNASPIDFAKRFNTVAIWSFRVSKHSHAGQCAFRNLCSHVGARTGCVQGRCCSAGNYRNGIISRGESCRRTRFIQHFLSGCPVFHRCTSHLNLSLCLFSRV